MLDKNLIGSWQYHWSADKDGNKLRQFWRFKKSKHSMITCFSIGAWKVWEDTLFPDVGWNYWSREDR